MKKSWLAGLMATALTVSMLAGCSSGASTTKEIKGYSSFDGNNSGIQIRNNGCSR